MCVRLHFARLISILMHCFRFAGKRNGAAAGRRESSIGCIERSIQSNDFSKGENIPYAASRTQSSGTGSWTRIAEEKRNKEEDETKRHMRTHTFNQKKMELEMNKKKSIE